MNSSLESIAHSSVRLGLFFSSHIWCWLHWRHAQKKIVLYSIWMCDENILNFNSKIERRSFHGISIWIKIKTKQNKTTEYKTRDLESFALKNVCSFIWIQRRHSNITCKLYKFSKHTEKQMASKTVLQEREMWFRCHTNAKFSKTILFDQFATVWQNFDII